MVHRRSKPEQVLMQCLRPFFGMETETTTKKTLSDHSISAHITHLHRLATRRFPSSHALWEAFISHSLTLASAVLISRTISSAIALHPHRVDYWLMASKFESEGDGKGLGGGNTEAARKVCMRGLRFLRGAEGEKEIWREWVRVEVAYVERVRGREAVLGLAKKVGETDEMEVDPEADGEDVEMAKSNKVDELMEKTEKEVEEKVLMGSEAILDGMIVRLVLDNALECTFSSGVSIVLSELTSIASSLLTFGHCPSRANISSPGTANSPPTIPPRTPLHFPFRSHSTRNARLSIRSTHTCYSTSLRCGL